MEGGVPWYIYIIGVLHIANPLLNAQCVKTYATASSHGAVECPIIASLMPPLQFGLAPRLVSLRLPVPRPPYFLLHGGLCVHATILHRLVW